jgi:hypothetical protein
MAPSATAIQAIEASPRLHDLLERLHAASEAQEKSYSQYWFYFKFLYGFYITGKTWSTASDNHMRDKFVALEQDKCHFMYLLARSINARNIVEAGTSFGVSTMYLALAVGQNITEARARGEVVTGKVIGTEKESSKAARARKHWSEAGEEVEPWIELREGDLRETLWWKRVCLRKLTCCSSTVSLHLDILWESANINQFGRRWHFQLWKSLSLV